MEFDFKLPYEWIQLFRIILSIYIAWMILLVPRKPLLKDNLKTRVIFVLLLLLLAKSDFISALLLIIIYFFSFQSVLHMENQMNTNTKEGYESEMSNTAIPTTMPTKMTMSLNLKKAKGFGTDKALNLI